MARPQLPAKPVDFRETVAGPTRDAVLAVGAAFALVAGRWSLVQEMRGYRAAASVLLASVGVDF